MPWKRPNPDLQNDPSYLTPRLNEVDAQLAERARSNYFYVTNEMDAVTDDYINNLRSSDIYALYDELLTDNAEYITKTVLGKEASGTLDWVRYVFEPSNYKETIILGANIHGQGTAGDPRDVAVTLYNFMNEIANNWRTSQYLAYMRWNVRFVILPVQNPWGFDNGSRQNFNNVDLNRNFDYYWDQWTSGENTYKGTAPFSEPESRYIRDTLLQYQDAIAYYDFHAWMDNANYELVYVGNKDSELNQIAYDLTGYLAKKYNNIPVMMDDAFEKRPSGFVYSEKVLNIPGANPEFVVYTKDVPRRSKEMMTRMLEWFGNLVWLSIQMDKKDKTKSVQYWYKYGQGTLPDVVISNTGGAGYGKAVENSLLNYENDFKIDGIAKVELKINVRNSSGGSSAQNFFVPIVYQYDSPFLNQNTDIGEFQKRFEAYYDGTGRMPLTLIAEIPIFKNAGKLHVGLGGYVTAGSCQVYNYTANVTVMPTENKDRFVEYYSSSAGWQKFYKTLD
jgi:Zinc carboxypeptidase